MTASVEAIVLGRTPPPVGQGWSVRWVGWGLGLFVLALAVFQTRNLLALRGWRERSRRMTPVRRALDVAMSFIIPTAILVVVFWQVSAFYGNRFNLRTNLAYFRLGLPDVFVLMIVRRHDPGLCAGGGEVGVDAAGRGQAGLALARGDTTAAEAHLRASSVGPDEPIGDRTDALHLAWLRLFLARGDPRAGGLAQRIIASAEAGGRHSTLIQALLLAARPEAVAAQRDAAAYLHRALALAEPEGYVRVFLDEGPALAALLQQAGPPPWLAHVLLPPEEAGGAAPTASPLRGGGQGGEVLIEPLSERELEVLRLLADGLSYAEIAGRLVVSLNTARFHVKEIYGQAGGEPPDAGRGAGAGARLDVAATTISFSANGLHDHVVRFCLSGCTLAVTSRGAAP